MLPAPFDFGIEWVVVFILGVGRVGRVIERSTQIVSNALGY